MFKAYKYQSETINSLRRELKNHSKVLIYSPTGSGKTIISKLIIDKIASNGYKVLFTVPRIKLAKQTKEKFGYGNLILGSSSEDNNSLLTIASIQSLYSRKITEKFDFIFIDECHYSHGSEYVNYIFDTYNTSKIIGLSATPMDEKGFLLQGYDSIISEVTVKELIKQGFLTDVEVYTSTMQPKIEELEIVNGDYNQTKASEILRESKILSNTLSEWKKLGSKLKTLVFATDISHSKELLKGFRELGFNAECVHSKMSEKDITRAYLSFKNNDIQILINVDMATFGFDEPSIECLLFARPIKSLRLYKQMIGRGIRTFKGKDKCLVIDCANVILDNGYPTDEIHLVKKPVISKSIDSLIKVEREVSGHVVNVKTIQRIEYLTQVSSLFDLYNQKVYPNEVAFQDDVKTFLKRGNWYGWRQNSGKLFKDGRWIHFTDKNGLPDITVIYMGVYFGIELKMKKGTFTKHQKITLPEFAEQGVRFFIIDSFTELFLTLELIYESVVKTSEGVLVKNYELSETQIKYRKKLKIIT